MASWTSGYVAEIDYTYGFYRELTPSLLAFAAAISNVGFKPSSSGLRFCELGCGQGFSANIIAAADPSAEIYATDFNPSQIAGARQLAEEGGLTNVHFYESAFADFAKEPSLPDSFDIIALHGIYSWISAENRRHIVDFIRRKLRPGGLVYISYNALPGWSAVMPLRRLLLDEVATRTGPIVPRIDDALQFIESLMKVQAGYFTQNPAVAGRVERVKGMSRAYIAHEYLNADWTPFYFADVARELGEAKLSFLCSAHLPDTIDSINLTADQLTIFNNVTDPVRRQGLRDYLINQQFRRDIFVKGSPSLPPSATQAKLLDQRLVLSTLRSDVPMKIQTTLGELELQSDVYAPLLDKLAEGPATVRQLYSEKSLAGLGWPRLRQALTVLVGSGQVQPCLPIQDEARRTQHARAFNTAVMRRAEWSGELVFLASPVTGGGLQVSRFDQMFLSALAEKNEDPPAHAWAQIAAQGQSLLKDGKPLSTPEENLAELRTRYVNFNEKLLPILRQTGVVLSSH